MATFDSYTEPLTHVLRVIAGSESDPLFVEYGPGGSTKIMKQIVPGARIISVEHNQKWYCRYLEEFDSAFDNITLLLRQTKNGYVASPGEYLHGRKARLVYIDGRKRSSCLQFAENIIDKGNGIIILHDAERPWYRGGYSAWSSDRQIWAGSPFNRTLILPYSTEDYEHLKYLAR